MLAWRDRTAVDGAKTLFLEEVQSDWHQQGKKYGYQSPDNVEYAMGLGKSFCRSSNRDSSSAQQVNDQNDQPDNQQ
jgi:hypothetical protein